MGVSQIKPTNECLQAFSNFIIHKKVIKINTTTILSIISLIVSVIATIISWYTATANIRQIKVIYKQKFDLVVRPRGEWRTKPPVPFTMAMQNQNFIKMWENEIPYIIDNDIGDNGVYYGVNLKTDIDPIAIKKEMLPTIYFDKVYVTKQGQKKHKQILKNRKNNKL